MLKKIIFTVLSAVLILVQAQTVFAQTTLNRGELVVLNTNADGDDGFSFMSLVDLDAGTKVHFTDVGWRISTGAFKTTNDGGTAPNDLQGIYGVCTYTVPSGGLSAGVVVSQDKTNSNSNFSAYSGKCNFPYISTFSTTYGDQIIVFQGTFESPTFIWALSYVNRTDDGYIHDWTTDGSGDASGLDDGNSDLPAGLSNGTNAMVISHTTAADYDNGWYSGATTSADADTWRSRVVNPSNWSYNDASGFTTHSGNTYTVEPASANITFTNGSSYTPSITRGSVNQALGRFQLIGDVSGSSLTAVSIKLNGSRTGLSNLKLWSSTDATFESGSDSPLGSTVSSDPGNGNSASFSSFSSAIGTGGTYYFLTGDVDVGATGVVQGVIVANNNLIISSGTLSGTITNAPLSNGDASLPVSLVSFYANSEGRSINLNWITESETDNLGFILHRRESTDAWIQIASYETHDALKGQGNTSSATEYTFTDSQIASGINYTYRLSDVSTTSEITIYAPLSITLDILPLVNTMEPAYPNPFNPRTYIAYHLAEDAEVNISVFNIMGRRLKSIYLGQQLEGSYHVYWNATDDDGGLVPTGTYIIRLQAGSIQEIQKVMLIR